MVEEWFSLQKMQVVSWVYLLVLTMGSWVVLSWSFAWAVLAGGIISIMSFLVSRNDAVGFIESMTPDLGNDGDNKQIKKKRNGLLIKFWLRFIVIGIILFLLIRSHKVNLVGLILGLSTVVCTVTFTALNVARHYLFSGRR